MILRFEFMRDATAQISVLNALRAAVPKFDSDPDFRSSYGSRLLILKSRFYVSCRRESPKVALRSLGRENQGRSRSESKETRVS